MEDMADRELEALIEPVKDRPYTEWSVDQMGADAELDARLGVHGETPTQAVRRGPGTVPISMRVPRDLLDRVRREAARRGTPYQRLMRELIESGLNASPGDLQLTPEQLQELTEHGSVTLRLRAS
jgi:predicted DNA-binding protein